MTKQFIVATTNKGKLKDFNDAFKQLNIEFVTIDEVVENVPDIIEDANTFEGNADLKVIGTSKLLEDDAVIVADDSGICVHALDNRPGVLSHRYASENPTEEENNNLLLSELQGHTDRTAHYCTVIALKLGNEIVHFKAIQTGTIAEAPRGNNGFAYDKVFIPTGQTKTLAEMDDATRQTYLARYQALRQFVNYFIVD